MDNNEIRSEKVAILVCTFYEPKTGGQHKYEKCLDVDYSEIKDLQLLCKTLSRIAIEELSLLDNTNNFISGEIYYKESFSSAILIHIEKKEDWYTYTDRRRQCIERHVYYPNEHVELI